MKDRRTSELKELQILLAAMPRVNKRGLAIDGGANVGLWTLELAKHFEQVMAFEPVDFSYRALRERTEHVHTIYPIRAALFDRRCQVTMQHPKKRQTSTAYYCEPAQEGATETVDAVAIDMMDMKGLELGLIKLDLEGAELRALEGAQRTLQEQRPVLIIEVVERQLKRFGDTPMDLHAWLLARGYVAAAEHAPNRVYIPC